jgi:lysophospholipase L1-like esterase
MTRRTVTMVALAIAPFIIYIVAKRIYWTYFRMQSSYSYTVEDYMIATAELQSNLKIDSGDIVFVGNSLTSHFPINELFGSTRFKNRGIGSNTTEHILRRIEPIARAYPSVVLLEAGINDFKVKKTVIDTYRTYKQIVEVIRRISPGTRVFVHSTLPVSKENLALMPAVDSLNHLLKRYCITERLNYIDLHPLLRKGPGLDSSYTWDGIHLNMQGYSKWKNEVEKYL